MRKLTLSAGIVVLTTCFTASSYSSVKPILAPTKATVTIQQPDKLPAQWTFTTAFTATTSTVAATPDFDRVDD